MAAHPGLVVNSIKFDSESMYSIHVDGIHMNGGRSKTFFLTRVCGGGCSYTNY